jgi:lysyl endopeptidase
MEMRTTNLTSKFVASLLVAGSFALSAGAAAPPAADPSAEVRAQPRVQSVETRAGLAQPGHGRAAHPQEVRIGAPASDEVEREIGRPRKGAPLKIGFARDVPALATEADAASALAWERLSDGAWVAAVTVTSDAALSVRAALRVSRLPDDARVRFQAPGAAEMFETSGHEIAEAIARDSAADAAAPAARTYWSPLVEGASITVEIELPAGEDPSAVSIAIPRLAHLVTSPAKDFVMTTQSASTCEIDAMCSTGWTSSMNAEARMIFSDGAGTFACSGTLVADQDAGSSIPYFLSANHCISTQSVASSLTTFWFYRASACNSGIPGPYQQLTGGATLLYASNVTDTSFLRLNNPPPAGAVYSGWFVASTPSVGSTVTGLHHPMADLLKISHGSVNGYLTCTAPTSTGAFSCSGSNASSSTFYDIGWSQGITEPGSSGSGLFLDNGQYLVGQLYGGSGDCVTPGDDSYGRFDVAYRSALSRWLSVLTLTVSRTGAGTGSVTSSPAGISCGAACAASFPSGSSVSLSAAPAVGSDFAGWSGACTGAGACTVSLNAAAGVTASFVPATAGLNVAVSGSGTVTSAPSGINCGPTCAAGFPWGTTVALGAVPAAGMLFSSWSGSCSGRSSCILTLAASTTLVGATFLPKSVAITALAPSLDPSLVGQAVTFAASVSGAAGTPTGTVAFLVDGAPVAGCTAVALASGAASCPVSGLAVGTHSVVASYSGDGQYNAGTSTPLAQTVSPAGTVQVSVAPRSVDFGGQSMATTSPARTVVVTNSGAATVAFSAIAASDPQFSATSDCAAIAPGAACSVVLAFTPSVAPGPVNTTVPAAATLSIASNASNSPVAVALSGMGEKSLVTHFYQSILRRSPDPSGKAFWQGEAARLATLGADLNETWFAMALQFFGSPEYATLGRDDAGFVTDLYATFFNRGPDAGGLAFWTGQIASGMPRGVVLVSFLFSPEFAGFTQSIFGASTARAESDAVMDFYRGILGRLPDDGGYGFWTQQFRTAECQGSGAVHSQADAISRSFTTSAEYLQRNRTNAEFISDMYDTFLRRGGDLQGVQFWIGQLATSAQSREQVRQAFVASVEFGGRLAAIAAQGCAP